MREVPGPNPHEFGIVKTDNNNFSSFNHELIKTNFIKNE